MGFRTMMELDKSEMKLLPGLRSKAEELKAKALRLFSEVAGFTAPHDPHEEVDAQAKLAKMRCRFKRKNETESKVNYFDAEIIENALGGDHALTMKKDWLHSHHEQHAAESGTTRKNPWSYVEVDHHGHPVVSNSQYFDDIDPETFQLDSEHGIDRRAH